MAVTKRHLFLNKPEFGNIRAFRRGFSELTRVRETPIFLHKPRGESEFSEGEPMVYLILYLLSGFFSLALQVIWQRQLCIITGGTMYSIASIISIWMVGLAIGSFVGGKVARNGKNLGALFCWTQILAGVYVLASPLLFHIANAIDARIFLLQEPHEALSIALRAALLLVILVIPISLIGAGFPILSSFLGKRRIASLYYLNALGSVAGALVVSFFFLEKIGVRLSVIILSCSLIVCNALVFLLTKKNAPSSVADPVGPIPDKKALKNKPPATAASKTLLVVIPVLFLISGFTSLSYEFLYNRIILFIFKESSYFSFAIILVLFILGISVGSYIYALVKKKIVSRSSKLVWFAALESFIGIWHIMMPALSVYIYSSHWVINPNSLPGHYFLATVLYRTSVAALLMLLPVIAFGFLYPLVIELYVDLKNKNTSETVGYIGFFNLIGSAIGPIITVFGLIALFQVGGALRVISLFNVLIGLAITLIIFFSKEISGSRLKSLPWLALPLLALWICFRTPVTFELFQYLARQVESTQLLYYKENAFSTVAVTREENGVDMLSINCISEVPTDYNALRTFRLLAYAPFMVNEQARSALTIAFGGGITFGSACEVQSLRDIRCCEIDKDVLDAAGFFSLFNHNVISTHRKNVVIEDGRRFVEKSGKKYDVIICDMTHPSLSDSWVLFTTEFYSACAAKLNAGGVMAQWVPIHGLPLSDYKVILRTFSKSFKEVSLFYVNNYTILLGSASPITISPKAFQALWDNPVVLNDLKNTHLSAIQDIERMQLMKSNAVRDFAGAGKIASEDFSPVQFSQKRLKSADNSQIEICGSFGEYLSANRSQNPAIIDYQLVTLKLREYIYKKDMIGLLVYFAHAQKDLAEKGLLDDEIAKALTSEDVKQMFVTYFFKQNKLERLLADRTDDNVMALKTLDNVVFTEGDESELIKGALCYQEEKYDVALLILMKLYQKRPYSTVSWLFNKAMEKSAKK
jgi:spermidine synthase